ncbi:hypothetical protein [Brevibacterium litoralis]|uniref:hypothetical protein n=1 Tax=Brevibacterium litoralis TaxID=3138935 RepID=UPI0032ECC420
MSHRSAARVWGLAVSGRDSGKLEVTSPHRSEKTRHVWVRKAPLPADAATEVDIRSLDGSETYRFLVTTPERTVADLMRTESQECGHVALESFLAHVHPGPGHSGDVDRPGRVPGFHGFNFQEWHARGATVPDHWVRPREIGAPLSWGLDVVPAELRELRKQCVDEILTGGTYGKVKSSAIETLGQCAGLSGSPLEARTAYVLHRLGVTGWVQQQEFFDSETGELDARVDIWFEKQRAVFEADGKEKYGADFDPRSGSFDSEKERQNRLAGHAGVVKRVTNEHLGGGSETTRPVGLMRMLREARIVVPRW